MVAESLPVGTIEVGAFGDVVCAAVGTEADVVLAATLVDDGCVVMAAVVEDSLLEMDDSTDEDDPEDVAEKLVTDGWVPVAVIELFVELTVAVSLLLELDPKVSVAPVVRGTEVE